MLCCGTSRLVRFPQINLRDAMPSLEGGEVGLISTFKTRAQQLFLAIISSHCFSLHISFFFSSVLEGGFGCFFSTLVALTTVNRILFSLRTIFLSYTILFFRLLKITLRSGCGENELILSFGCFSLF